MSDNRLQKLIQAKVERCREEMRLRAIAGPSITAEEINPFDLIGNNETFGSKATPVKAKDWWKRDDGQKFI